MSAAQTVHTADGAHCRYCRGTGRVLATYGHPSGRAARAYAACTHVVGQPIGERL